MIIAALDRFTEQAGGQATESEVAAQAIDSSVAEAGIPGLVDAIVEATETGSSLKANRLRIVDTICESTPRFIVNCQAWEDSWKRDKAENLLMLLKGALEAEAKVGLKMNVPKAQLDQVIAQLPALHTPTISSQQDEDWAALEIIADEKIVRELIPQLKRVGAEGIIEYPLNKVVY